MKRRITTAKVAAVASSVLLVGAYVVYRATAARRPDPAPVEPVSVEEEVVLPGSKSGAVVPVQSDPGLLMTSSKSGPVLQPGQTRPTPDVSPRTAPPPPTPPASQPMGPNPPGG